jgi:hypothetical protein
MRFPRFEDCPSFLFDCQIRSIATRLGSFRFVMSLLLRASLDIVLSFSFVHRLTSLSHEDGLLATLIDDEA